MPLTHAIVCPRKRRTQRERSRAATERLVAAGRDLFAADGYAATSLEAVCAAADVTKGALYHHFAGKRELFEAVFRAELRRLCDEVARAYDSEEDPWEGFKAGCRAFMEASLDGGVQRITLLDAPSVLGWEGMRRIEAEFELALLKRGLAEAMAAGRIPRGDVDPLAHVLFGALCEAVMMVARSDDPEAVMPGVQGELEGMLDRLA